MKRGSLRDFDSLADRIRLHRQVDKRPVVIVEGPSDERTLQDTFGGDLVYFAAGTRTTALEQSRTLHKWGQTYFLSVVDRDFDDTVANLESENLPIHAYENADLEAMICVSGTTASMLAEFGSMAKIETQGGITGIVEKLYQLVEPVTRLRRANVENEWGLRFDGVDLRAKVEKKTLEFKLQGYCAALAATSEGSPGQGTLFRYATGDTPLTKAPTCPRGAAPYFRGRDFLAFLSVALCQYCGTRRPQSVEPEILEGTLRLSGSRHLKEGAWGQELIQAVSKLSCTK